MTGEEWTVIAGLVDEWWPGRFERSTEDAWFVALEAFPAQAVLDALRARILRGGPHRPSVAELVGELRADPAEPTFEEAYELIYGLGGVLRARPHQAIFDDIVEKSRAQNEAAADRAREMHPLVTTFVLRYGITRLRELELDHPEYGDVRRRELRQAWDEHCEAMEDRDVVALASRRQEGGLQSFDPLAVLGPSRLGLPAAEQVGTGEGER